VSVALDGPIHARYYVEAESEEEATMGGLTTRGTRLSMGYDTHFKVEHVVDVREADEKQKPEWEVMGVYTDTDNLQPFTKYVQAEGPEKALKRAALRAGGLREKELVDEALSDGQSAKMSASRANVRPVSVRRRNSLNPTERLHKIDGYPL
jgi:hypothetical protein